MMPVDGRCLVEVKVCCTCKIEKCASCFGKRENGTKLRSECKQCEKKYRDEHKEEAKLRSAAHYRNNRDRVLARQKEYVLENKETKIAYGKTYREKNKDRENARVLLWREQNKEHALARERKWHKENKDRCATRVRNRRARLRNAEGFHTLVEIDEIFIEQTGLCVYCKQDISNGFDVDHIIPISR